MIRNFNVKASLRMMSLQLTLQLMEGGMKGSHEVCTHEVEAKIFNNVYGAQSIQVSMYIQQRH